MSGGERTLVAERDAGETFPRAPRLHMDESGRARIAEKKRDVAAPLEAERAGGIENAESEADGPDEPDRAPVAPPGIPPSAFATLPLGSRRPKEPAEAGLPAVIALAAADDGGLAEQIIDAVVQAMLALW